MKSILVAGLLTTSMTAIAASPNMVELNKELEIMSGVIDTALKQDASRDGIRYRSVETTYLAKQGVVFDINVRSRGAGWSAQLSQMLPTMPVAPVAPRAPVVISSSDSDFEFEVSEDWEEFAEETMERLSDVFRESSSQIRELRSQERELASEKRELERRKRDLEFELRMAGNGREKEIKEELKELDKEMNQYVSREKELENHAAELEKEQNERVAKQKEAQEQAYKQFLANFEGNIGDTLCRFGAGLRSLPDDENISFVLKDFSRDTRGKDTDRIYVFSKRKVKDCLQEKINPSQLISSADIYEF